MSANPLQGPGWLQMEEDLPWHEQLTGFDEHPWAQQIWKKHSQGLAKHYILERKTTCGMYTSTDTWVFVNLRTLLGKNIPAHVPARGAESTGLAEPSQPETFEQLECGGCLSLDTAGEPLSNMAMEDSWMLFPFKIGI